MEKWTFSFQDVFFRCKNFFIGIRLFFQSIGTSTVCSTLEPRPDALDFSFDLEFNIPWMYYLMNNSFMECFVHYLMNSNCTCVRSTTLDNFALDQTSLDKKQSSRLHSTRWPNALDISLNMQVERCIVKSRERLAWALYSIFCWISVVEFLLLRNGIPMFAECLYFYFLLNSGNPVLQEFGIY